MCPRDQYVLYGLRTTADTLFLCMQTNSTSTQLVNNAVNTNKTQRFSTPNCALLRSLALS